MESNKRKLQIKAFEYLDRMLVEDVKRTLTSAQIMEILRCVVNWIYVERNEINLAVLLDITSHIHNKVRVAELNGKKLRPEDVADDDPDFLRDLQKL